MKKQWSISLILLLLVQAAAARQWVLSDNRLEIKFDDQTGLLAVTDKRCNVHWQEAPLAGGMNVTKTTQQGNTITAVFSGRFSFSASFALTPASALEINIIASAATPMEDFSFPAAFITPGKDYHLLYTDGEGFLLPVTDTAYPIGRNKMYSMSGLSMPWMGITDSKLAAGYMAILETPDDAEVNVLRTNGLLSFEPVWLSVKGQFGYTRKLRYHFFDKGGYLAQCKQYREYVWQQNGTAITLAEKQKRFPAIEKMIGAVHIYLWDDARETSFAEDLKKAGIEKAFILWNPNHPPYPEAGYDTKLKALGYLSGVYELFRDAKLRDTIGEIDTHTTSGVYFSRFSYPGLFNKITLIQKDGKLHYSGFGYDINPQAVLPFIPGLRTNRELTIYPHEAFFLDGFLASGLYECYSAANPLTRTQYKEAVIKMNRLFEDKYKMIVGIEWGADYGVPTAAYAHGMTTLHRMLYRSKDRRTKGSVYYYGDWSNPSRPSMMVGEYVADKNYLQWAINEKIRVPLYQLVYHDAIVTTFRWDDANHHMPEIWWKKDLFNILYGTAPLWTLDRPRWDRFKTTFIESYKKICPWLQQIGYDEMLSHRFVSTDGQVQETVFASGRAVMVNFSDTAIIVENKTVPARGYIFFQRPGS